VSWFGYAFNAKLVYVHPPTLPAAHGSISNGSGLLGLDLLRPPSSVRPIVRDIMRLSVATRQRAIVGEETCISTRDQDWYLPRAAVLMLL
jgi:hypothetical protein